ncbi:MAG: FAD-dependent monooxygenase [Ferruginibacter sp.]
MNHENFYDCAIIGGGLGGLTLAITLSKKGYRIVLIEKEQYPFHKVCGEYISMESWDFLTQLGLPLKDMELPVIKKLIVSAPSGNELSHELPLGGFGISRYKIDYELKKIAVECGVTVMEHCKAADVIFNNNLFQIITSKGNFESKVCCGSFGKRSNLDIKWKRNFIKQSPNKLNNFIAVKYHVKFKSPEDTIALHNFKDGYCGFSKIEDDKYCLCYLTNAANLKNSNNSIEEMEKNILSKNPHLSTIFLLSTKLYSSPLSISQISFQQKAAVENHLLMIGDAAGLITPLCGNGMSMAMHAGKIASIHISDFLDGKTNRLQMEIAYAGEWKKTFGNRLRTGRVIQRFFGKVWLTNLFIKTMKLFPSLTNMIIKQTHGDPF